MRLNDLPSEFQKALPIVEKIKSAGFEAYFVGGSVRDALLERPIHDVDIASSSYPQEIKQIFPRTIDIGIEHGTVLVLENGGEYEVTTFRTEDVYVDYRRPSSVSFVRSLEEDLKRRDFTVNALALDESGQVIDKFGGLDDLDKKLLRAVGNPAERFNEDALRIMRGLRFAASLDFTIEEKTFEAMKTHAPLLEKISVERSFIEFDKLLTAPYWRKGIKALLQTRAYAYLPGLQETDDKWLRFLEAYQEDFTFQTSEQAWAALIIALDIGNSKTFLKKWKTSVQFQKTVEALTASYRLRLSEALSARTVYQYGKEWLSLTENLRQGQGLPVDFERISRLDQELIIHDKHEIAVNGGMIMTEFNMKPGPQLGQILTAIEAAIVDGRLDNHKAAIFKFIKDEKRE